VDRMLWIASITLVGWLLGLRRGWRRQMWEAVACAAALTLACWQYPRLTPFVRMLWPAANGSVARPVALVYLFATGYGLAHALMTLYAPDRSTPQPRCWLAGLIGATQAAILAYLAVFWLPDA